MQEITIEDLLALIVQGEGEKIEFKARSTNMAETVCAMANTAGGCIIIGVDNKGKIRGISEREKERIVSSLQSLMPAPEVTISDVEINGKRIVVIKVEKSKRFITLGPNAYIRIGRSNRPLDIEELAVVSVEELKVTFDTLPSSVPQKEINPKLLKNYFVSREKKRGIPLRGELKENLKRIKAIKGNHLTLAGLLFFTDEPQVHLPWTGIRLIELHPDGETKEIIEFKGPLWKMIEEVYEEVLRRLPRKEIRIGVKRESFVIFPEEAIREAIINAVAHRNYRIRADIRIFLDPQRLAIKNPGSFPPGVDPEDPEHIPRNPLICQYLYDMGYIEKYGFGIIRMRKAVKEHPLAQLEFKLSSMKTEVIFSTQTSTLSEDEHIILTLLKSGPLSSTEIAESLKISKVTALKKLKKLKKMNLIKKEGKGKNVKYSLRK